MKVYHYFLNWWKVMYLNRYILLDDNLGITTVWELEAINMNIDLSCFNDVELFKKAVITFDKNSYFYIDLHLKEDYAGIEVAKWIKSRDFINVFLITADIFFLPNELDKIPCIYDKYPPFKKIRLHESSAQ